MTFTDCETALIVDLYDTLYREGPGPSAGGRTGFDLPIRQLRSRDFREPELAERDALITVSSSPGALPRDQWAEAVQREQSFL